MVTHTRARRNALEWAAVPLGKALTYKRAGHTHSLHDAPDLKPRGKTPLTLTSHSFPDGGEIPSAHTELSRQPNISPDLEWSKLPAKTKQLLLVMEDVDVPRDRPFIHMVALFSPAITHFDDGDLSAGDAEVRFIRDTRGSRRYRGPRPFPGHGRHHYSFHLYALDTEIGADVAVANLDALRLQVTGHVLASGVLTGWKEG